MSRRTARLSSQIRRLLAEGITHLSDPRIATFTSVTKVELSPDLTLATVHVSVMGDTPSAADLSVVALEAARGRLRSLLAGEMSIRRVPELRFRLDQSVQTAFDTVRVIDQLRQEDQRLDAKHGDQDQEDKA